MNELEIFELGLALAKALGGDKEAIADVALLYQRHPEMFENIKDVVETIEKVIKDPDLVMKNPSPNRRSDDEILAAKKLDTQKMGEIGIRNDEGTNVIFHANKKRIREFERLEEKIITDGEDAHTPHIQAQSLDGRLVQKNISSAKSILPKNPQSKPYDRDKNPQNPKEKTKKRR
ncbi:hypothetical protein [Helicobacter sp. 11S03491-1]|uniref:hypothetical protein n=1 Tax=Helicobacter sp. 11S03491-1 TaxID=1476196 RepID=UPI000BD0859C|nr:hypothetical protein [Helicobacter sp. 11S03491-1]PAF42173.1 hypothetical protein BKH45_04290 [Helicobacter sp. 11S03491-1]